MVGFNDLRESRGVGLEVAGAYRFESQGCAIRES
jgi:hypothetical protein